MLVYPDNIPVLTKTLRRPDRGYEEVITVPGIIKYNGQIPNYERRRLVTRRKHRSYVLTYTNILDPEAQGIEDFYNLVNGEFSAFKLNLDHLSKVGFVTVRFDGDITKKHVISSTKINVYNIEIKLIEVFA